jgi:acetyl/propionyl-CoA carboxylase alpha subunit
MKTNLVRVLDPKTGETQPIQVEPLGGDAYRVTIGDTVHDVEGFPTESGVSFRLGGRSFDLPVHRDGDSLAVRHPSGTHRVDLIDERIHKLRNALGVGAGALKPELLSPMTGKVVLVKCSPGDEVAEGTTLIIIEAMKMENEIKAPGDVSIKDVRVAAGDVLAPGDVLVTFNLD